MISVSPLGMPLFLILTRPVSAQLSIPTRPFLIMLIFGPIMLFFYAAFLINYAPKSTNYASKGTNYA